MDEVGAGVGARCGKASLKDASFLDCASWVGAAAGAGADAGAGSDRMGIEVGVGCCGSALLDDDDHSQPMLPVWCVSVEPVSMQEERAL